MAKKLYDILVSELETTLNSIDLDLLSIDQGSKKNDNGDDEPFTRLELEVPKGNGSYSRCRFFCKLPPTHLVFSESDFDSGISVNLIGLRVTFISAQHEIYTRADDIRIV